MVHQLDIRKRAGDPPSHIRLHFIQSIQPGAQSVRQCPPALGAINWWPRTWISGQPWTHLERAVHEVADRASRYAQRRSRSKRSRTPQSNRWKRKFAVQFDQILPGASLWPIPVVKPPSPHRRLAVSAVWPITPVIQSCRAPLLDHGPSCRRTIVHQDPFRRAHR